MQLFRRQRRSGRRLVRCTPHSVIGAALTVEPSPGPTPRIGCLPARTFRAKTWPPVILGLVVALAYAFATASAASGAIARSAVEGEHFNIAQGSGYVAREVGRSGGRVLVVTAAGRARATLRAAAPAWLNLSIRAVGCRGLPRVVVRVNRTNVIVTTLRRGPWQVLSSSNVIRAGTFSVTVRLANQIGGRCRRAVRIDRVWFAARPAAAAPNPVATPPPPVAGVWRPAQATTWQWQLSGVIDQSVPAQMYDIDLFDNSASLVASLQAKGRRVVCYISAGSYEGGRPDASSFPAAVLGNTLDGWPNERWLDVRRLDLLGPIMEKRLDQCRAKGFDGVEPDNVDGYSNGSGFPLKAADQLAYNRFLAQAAHARGLSIGLKNDLAQAKELEPAFDWAINEQCFQYNECGLLSPFLNAGKAVFVTEYDVATSSFCPSARSMKIMAMRKRLQLDAYREPCW